MADTYRLNSDTSVKIIDSHGHLGLHVIPEGEVVTLVGPLSNNPAFVEVTWSGKRAQMFAVDLAERGELLPGPTVKIRRFTASGREL